ncbi:MAG TPA: methyltransferase domain-containing protein [Vicinamibacteria bacterium]|jgi:SAM-dependent methyltransferase|nr:methyltransferase domain-containing protein [Vicinamibacteria bacterium]
MIAAVFLILGIARSPERPQQAPNQAEQKEREGRYGNPADLDSYISRMEDPSRAEWQQPDRVVKALGLRPGQTACDIGSGPGYFTLRLVRQVGTTGHVYAVDVEPRILEVLRERVGSPSAKNVTPVLALADDPMLPEHVCDVILIVDTYHHFPDGPSYLARLARSLKKGGRLADVDFHKRETPVGPSLDHRVARDDFLKDARRAGLALATEFTFLPYQYFLVLKPGGKTQP